MLIRLFLGIPWLKGFPRHPLFPLTLAISEGKTFLGTYTEAASPLLIDNLNLQYSYVQDLLYKAIPPNHAITYKDIPLVIFPEILFGSSSKANHTPLVSFAS
ncbi:hypothetical protein [Candidatus Chlamydia sanziniae]|uniref:Uncharacterized protein n=1 Tax=Candidatus Chlamydia sanziniae TaxID=1806891 RepID=A0A1A9HTT7_9CHLA|nr:hypothetical protein [Candidatus Chlamydia sanziniae]ANH78408.1 hypothetical protein Cs308_0237 [Candidatus Chlamydia sanziniae]